MVFKKNNPGCSAGGGCGCKPCCADGWDYVRAALSLAEATFYGLDVLTYPLSGTILKSVAIDELDPGGGYQCSIGAPFLTDVLEDSTNASFYGGVPKRCPLFSYVVGGTTYYRYSACNAILGAECTFPGFLVSMGVRCLYSMDYTATADPRSSFVSAGYTYANLGTYESWTRSTHANNMNYDFIVNRSVGGKIFDISAGYSGASSNTADYMSYFPSSVIAEPVFNPGGLKVEFNLS